MSAVAGSGALACARAGICGGCPSWAESLEAQRAAKRAALLSAWQAAGLPDGVVAAAELAEAGALGFRERLDMRLADGALGMVDAAGAVVPLATCPLATPALARAFEALVADLPPVPRASLRLRVKPACLGGELVGGNVAGGDVAGGDLVVAQPGLWIDLGHVALKALLDEGAWLGRWAPRAVIELGPKGRVVQVADGVVTLGPATTADWSTTWVEERPVPLATRVMDFGQPGSQANRVLVAAVLRAARDAGARRVLELGAGAGNLTIPLRQAGFEVRAVELETTALKANLARAAVSGVEALAGSYERAEQVPGWVHGRDTIVCDPARGGLGRFIDGLATLSPSLRPRAIVYVSCHMPALVRDAARLAALGWEATHLRGVDQFPWTPHAEWIGIFTRA